MKIKVFTIIEDSDMKELSEFLGYIPSDINIDDMPSILAWKFPNGPAYYSSDNMEPEDARFHRDLAWVANAISEAYITGVDDGKQSVYERIKG